MVLIFHIFVAIGSLAFTTYLYLRPSKSKLKLAYSMVATTLLSGTYLVWSTKTPLLQACTMGLVYLSLIAFGLAFAHLKLSKNTSIE